MVRLQEWCMVLGLSGVCERDARFVWRTPWLVVAAQAQPGVLQPLAACLTNHLVVVAVWPPHIVAPCQLLVAVVRVCRTARPADSSMRGSTGATMSATTTAAAAATPPAPPPYVPCARAHTHTRVCARTQPSPARGGSPPPPSPTPQHKAGHERAHTHTHTHTPRPAMRVPRASRRLCRPMGRLCACGW